MTRLAVFNQKGGVGKTTTALNLAAALAPRGLRPLLLNLDAQPHLSQILAPAEASSESVFAHYSDARPLRELVRPVALARGGYGGDRGGDLIPAHAELMKVDSLFGKGPRIRWKQPINQKQSQSRHNRMLNCFGRPWPEYFIKVPCPKTSAPSLAEAGSEGRPANTAVLSEREQTDDSLVLYL